MVGHFRSMSYLNIKKMIKRYGIITYGEIYSVHPSKCYE